MQAIPEQLAATLPEGSVRLNTPVSAVAANSVVLAHTGETLHASAVVLATDGPTAYRLLDKPPTIGSRSVTCFYFAFPGPPPIKEPILILNGEGQGLINNLCFPNAVAPSYAPQGQSLASVTVLGRADSPDVLQAVTGELANWFGKQTKDWRFLKAYEIVHAQPEKVLPGVDTIQGVHVAGDWRDTPSINGALASGQAVAAQLLAVISNG
jgi:protoporphyrinogen oxidase